MLKKVAFVIAAFAMLQGVAFAAIGSTYTSVTDTVFVNMNLTFKPSNNVQVLYIDDNQTAPQLYTIGSKNTSGDTVYSTSNMSSNIYKKKSDTTKPGVQLDSITGELPSNPGESLNWSGWDVL